MCTYWTSDLRMHKSYTCTQLLYHHSIRLLPVITGLYQWSFFRYDGPLFNQRFKHFTLWLQSQVHRGGWDAFCVKVSSSCYFAFNILTWDLDTDFCKMALGNVCGEKCIIEMKPSWSAFNWICEWDQEAQWTYCRCFFFVSLSLIYLPGVKNWWRRAAQTDAVLLRCWLRCDKAVWRE